MINPSCLVEIELSAEEIENENLREIFSAIQTMSSVNQVIDVVTVSDYLDKITGKYWLPIVGQLAKDTPSIEPKNVKAYSKIIREEHRIKSAIELATGLVSDLQESRDLDSVDSVISDLMALNRVSVDNDTNVKGMCQKAADELEKAFNEHLNGRSMGISTGLTELDNKLGGFHKSDLIVIPARPSMGKTALMLNMALNSKSKCGIISSEQGSTQLGLRCISIQGSVSGSKMRNGDLKDPDWAKIEAGLSNLLNKEIWVNDKPDITIQEIQRKAREWVFKYGIEILYVDYIQRINTATRHESKIRQVEEVTIGLKNLAKELNIPVVALAQVNRECEKGNNRRPNMGHVADASIVEKECDVMIVLYRDEVYDPDSPDKGIAELGVLKNRHGPIGLTRVSWRGEYMQFRNLYEVV